MLPKIPDRASSVVTPWWEEIIFSLSFSLSCSARLTHWVTGRGKQGIAEGEGCRRRFVVASLLFVLPFYLMLFMRIAEVVGRQHWLADRGMGMLTKAYTSR